MEATITLSQQDAKELHSLLPKLIKAQHMLDNREITPTYNEVMILVKIFNQLQKQTIK